MVKFGYVPSSLFSGHHVCIFFSYLESYIIFYLAFLQLTLDCFLCYCFSKSVLLNGHVTSTAKHTPLYWLFPSCWTFTLASIFILSLNANKVCWAFLVCLCRSTGHAGPIWTLSKGCVAIDFAWTQNGRCGQETGSGEKDKGGWCIPLGWPPGALCKKPPSPGSSPQSCTTPHAVITPCPHFVSSWVFFVCLFHYALWLNWPQMTLFESADSWQDTHGSWHVVLQYFTVLNFPARGSR